MTSESLTEADIREAERVLMESPCDPSTHVRRRLVIAAARSYVHVVRSASFPPDLEDK